MSSRISNFLKVSGFVSILVLLCTIYRLYPLIRKTLKRKFKCKQDESTASITQYTPTPVSSLLEVTVTLPSKVIYKDQNLALNYDPSELAQLPKVMLGEGTLGPLFKVVLHSGSTVAIKRVREVSVTADDLESWINFFGGIRDGRLLPIQFSFWYGGEAFLLYEYFCLGSLEELLHGKEGIQFSPLNWETRRHIALCAAMAVASIHSLQTKNGMVLVCGVIKSSNVLIRMDFSACLSGFEIPYIVSPATIVRRNLGRVAPELKNIHNRSQLVFTEETDVYSFGILLIELVTGKRPTMTDLREYVRDKRKEEELRGICDKKMGEVNENMLGMIGIARLCLSRGAKARPTMDMVVKMIQKLED